MNKQLQKVIDGLEHCMRGSNCYHRGVCHHKGVCPYGEFSSFTCQAELRHDALELLKEYDSALRGMVYQYCTVNKEFLKGKDCSMPDQEVFFNCHMSAGEEAFKVLNIENGQEVKDDFIWS